MGPGYVVAAVLETSGLIGLVVGGFVLRAERQARVADLRDFLRSGQSSLSAQARPGSSTSRSARIAAEGVSRASRLLVRPSDAPSVRATSGLRPGAWRRSTQDDVEAAAEQGDGAEQEHEFQVFKTRVHDRSLFIKGFVVARMLDYHLIKDSFASRFRNC